MTIFLGRLLSDSEIKEVAESFTKNNYRLAAADENGSFSNLTSRAERNVIDGNEQATISLETFRTTQ